MGETAGAALRVTDGRPEAVDGLPDGTDLIGARGGDGAASVATPSEDEAVPLGAAMATATPTWAPP